MPNYFKTLYIFFEYADGIILWQIIFFELFDYDDLNKAEKYVVTNKSLRHIKNK